MLVDERVRGDGGGHREGEAEVARASVAADPADEQYAGCDEEDARDLAAEAESPSTTTATRSTSTGAEPRAIG